MNTGDELRPRTVTVVVLQQQLPSLLVQRRLRVRVNEQTFHGNEDMADSVGRLPILLQRVDTDFA